MQREQVMDNETNKKKTGHFFFRDPRSVSARILWHQLLSNVLFLGTPSNIRYYWEPWWLILTAQWTCLRDIWGIREVRLWAFQWGWFQKGSAEGSNQFPLFCCLIQQYLSKQPHSPTATAEDHTHGRASLRPWWTMPPKWKSKFNPTLKSLVRYSLGVRQAFGHMVYVYWYITIWSINTGTHFKHLLIY